MITPVFRILQDDTSLTFLITAPYARLADAEILINGNEFKFFASPYFLRLVLPGQLDENENKVSYDSDSGIFTTKARKTCQGEMFDGLDMITSLLSVPKQRIRQPLIQEVGNEDVRFECQADCENQEQEEDEIDWCLEQALPEEESLIVTGEKYGFANQKAHVFPRLGEEVSLAIDLKDPDSKSRAVRRKERLSEESITFDEEYYLSCLFEDQDTIERLIRQSDLHAGDGELDDSDVFDMKNLITRSYLLNNNEKKQLLFGLVDILFAYAYDWRTCEGEQTSESNWTIAKISATLSWMETFDSAKDVIISCYRRALIFPLFRHHQLNVTVMKDVVAMIRSGRKHCLKSLLRIRRLFNQTPDCRYILNDIYISDYCVWVQKVKDKTLEKLASVVEEKMAQVTKEDLNLDLDLLEKAASLTLLEQNVLEQERKSASCDKTSDN